MKKVYRKGEAWGACLGVGEGCFQLCALSTDPKLSRGGHRFDSKLINFEFFFSEYACCHWSLSDLIFFGRRNLFLVSVQNRKKLHSTLIFVLHSQKKDFG